MTLEKEDEKEQLSITANKMFTKQDIGLTFKHIDNMIFISSISLDSIYQDTEIELGDRVVSVNGTNFMSYGDVKYVRKLIQKAPKEITITVEKGHKNFNPIVDVDPRHSMPTEPPKMPPKRVSSFSKRSKSKQQAQQQSESDVDISLSSGDIPNGSNKSQNSSRRKGNKPMKIRSLTKSKGAADGNSKNNLTSFDDLMEHLKIADEKEKANKVSLDSSDESSMGKDELLAPPRSPNEMTGNKSFSKMGQSSLGRSALFQLNDHPGDYIKVTVQKNSEANPGIAFQKTGGSFILTAVPNHEKRITIGQEILAINGTTNISTVIKADDIMRRVPGEVSLVLDYSTPVVRKIACPCCGEMLDEEGQHRNGKKLKYRRRGRVDDQSVSESVTESVATKKMSNHGPPGSRVPSIPETSGHYNYDEYHSDDTGSEQSGEEEKKNEVQKIPTIKDQIRQRASVSRYKVNDKFMVRVKKSSKEQDPGITLFDYDGCIYVNRIEGTSPFIATPITTGDRIVSINGRKELKSVAEALALIEEKEFPTLFVLRPDPEEEGYAKALANAVK